MRAPDPEADSTQVAHWAGYGLPRLIGWCAVGSVVLGVARYLLGDLVFQSAEAASNAVAFGLAFFVVITAAALWTRHQARRGRRSRWMGSIGR